MTCSILTEDRWARLLVGRLNNEEKTLIFDHLEIDCPDCEYIFERMSEGEEERFRVMFNHKAAQRAELFPFDAVAGDIGHVHHTISEPSLPVWRRVLRALFVGKPHMPAWAGVAAMLLLVTGIMTQFDGVHDLPSASSDASRHLQFEKGPKGGSASFNLQFAIGHPLEQGEGFAISRGIQGDRVSPADRLFLHYDLSADGYVYIFACESGKETITLYPEKSSQSTLWPAGSYDVLDNNRMNGFSLADVRGGYAVVGVYSPKPINQLDELISLIQQAMNVRTGSVNESIINSIYKDIAISVVYFDVAT